MLTATISTSSSGTNAILAGVSGYKYRILGFLLTYSGTVTAKFQSGSTDMTGELYGIAGGSLASPVLPMPNYGQSQQSQFVTNPGDPLNINLSGAVAVGGYVLYERVPQSM